MTSRIYKKNRLKFLLVILLFSFLFLDIFIATKIYQDRLPPAPAKPTAVQEAQRIASECAASRKDWRICYMEQFTSLTKISSFAYALSTLRELDRFDLKARECHLMAHAISTAEMAKDPNAWKDYLTKIDANYCTGGFIHGTVEGLSRHDPNFTLNENTLPQICEIIKKSVKGDGGDQYCAHITGHVLLAEKIGNIADAVAVCDKVPQQIRYQCYGGIFMESVTRDNLVLHGYTADLPTTQQTTADQEKICRQYKGLAATGCWREISHMFGTLNNFNPEKTYAYCNHAKIAKDREECILHAAGLIVRDPQLNNNPQLEASTLPALCKSFNEGKYNRCISEVVNTLMSASTNFADRARKFCDTISPSYQKSCFEILDRRLSDPPSPRED